MFSNVFEVASHAKPWERVCVAKNFEYVIEAARAEGSSPYWTARHDEFVLCMDGRVEILIHALDQPAKVIEDRDGAHRIDALPASRKMGRIVLGRGHMGLLPAGSAYRLRADKPSVVLLPNDRRPRNRDEVGADSAKRSEEATMSSNPIQTQFAVGDADADTGYRSFRAGGFELSRDRYFAYMQHGAVIHQMAVDAFLRAIMRDVAWGFFYGTVNFDDVLGTNNYYGEVEIFLGAKNEAFVRAKRDVTERFRSDDLMRTFKAMLADWTKEGFDPFAAPLETGTTIRSQTRQQHQGDRAAAGQRARAWSVWWATPRSEPTRTATRSTACSRTCRRISRWSKPNPASRTKSPRSTCSATCRAPT